MRKIIPLIVLVLLSAFFTKAQNVSQAESNLALQLVSSQDAIISQELLSNVRVLYTYEDAATGIRYVSLQQTYKGIPVYNQIQALSFRNGKLASNFGVLDPNMEKAVNVPSGIPGVSAESAVQSALSDRGFRASQMAIAINRKDEGKFVEFGDMGVSRENITAQLTWVPDELTKQYYLAWQVYIIPKTTSDYWMVRVSAVDNSILGMDNYTDYDHWGNPFENPSIKYPGFEYGNIPAPENSSVKNFFDFKKPLINTEDPNLVTTATYRVVPFPAESPLHPGGAPALRTDPWNNPGVVPNAVTLRWHTGAAAADYSHSRSNNVWAYHDRTNQNTGDITRSANSTTAFPNLTFDFVPDFTLEPTVTSPPNQQFNITNLFYWNNIAHDILYAYGFTEPGRNFQDDNLGRGGNGNDHVNAEAQDGSGSNNANFSTPADGGSGRMQMYLWTAPTPDRDGDVDNGIILHELGHGVSNRSNPGGTGCLGNAEAAGEGWSDYIGLMLTQNWATSTLNSGFNTPRGIGTYALNQPNNGPGIRPQRYCTDFAVNNATYATLPGQAIPHGVGWVFCSALWELTWELINDPSTTGIDPNIYNFAGTGGNIVAMRLMMEGLRTQPCQPGFITARDAILAADVTLYGGSHTCAIWRAFARRGMGFGAAQGSSTSINDQTVSFAMPPTCVVAGPTVTINQAAAQVDPTTVSPINFTVVFSEAVTGFATGDVSLGGTAGATTGTVTGSGTTYNVAVSGMTTTGTVIATIPAGVATNGANEPNNPSTSTDNTVTYITNPPGVCTTFVGSVGPANNPVGLRAFRDGVLSTCAAPGACTASTLTGSLHYVQHTWTNPTNAVQCVTVSYSNPTTNFSFVTAHNGSVVLTNYCTNWLGDPGSSAPAGGTPIVWSFNAPPLATIVFHVGNVTAGQTADYSLQISAPNCAAAAPGVTINQAAAQPDPTNVSPINFTVVFDQAVTGFATGDVVLTGTAGATTGVVTGSGTTYNVAVSGMTGSGTVIATIPAGVAINGAGDPNTASTSTDNTVTYNAPAGPAGCLTTIAYSGAPVAIPDGVPGGVNIPINVSGVGTIADLNFRFAGTAASSDPLSTTVGLNHSWIGDLRFTLTSPSATTVTFFDRPGVPASTFGCNNNNLYNLTLDDDGALPSIETQCDAGGTNSAFPSGNFAPNNPFSAFDGQNADGVWILNVSDNAGGDIGTLRAFEMQFFAVAPTVNPIANDTVCNGANAGPYNFSSSTPGATFSWTNSNTAIGLGASGTGNIPAFTATNPGTAPIAGTVTVTASTNVINLAGSLTAGDGVLTDRIFRDAVASTCAAPKTFPGLFGAGSYFYDTHTITNNTGSSQCVTVSYNSPTAELVHVTAYNGSFDPLNQAANYIADGGSSSNNNTPVTFSFTAAAGQTIVFVATEPISGESNPNYTISITNLRRCDGNPRSFSIRVLPTGTVNAIPNQVVCRGQTTAPVNFTGTVPNTIFNWTNDNPGIGLAAAGTGNIPAFVAQNNTGVPQVGTITVTPVYAPNGPATPVVTTFNSTGAVQTFTVPAGITSINIKAWGAQGNRNAGGIAGGLGGYAEGNLAVTPGQVLNVMVGGGNATSVTGGFNGGGAAGSNPGCAAALGGGGGGASDVRVAPYALANRVIVGAGGGGAGGNRTAGCGRGAGGGGGGGLWGGGGGAGWPGVPPGGPVPTGGTQSAGGAGGVTTFSPGPTNGSPGVLGVGGAGGNEVGSAQGTPTGPAEPGGNGGGLIGANGNYNPSNNWNGQSGAGGSSYIGGVTSGVTTPGLRAGAGQVQITYTPIVGLTCAGTPRTFTITVNPNQDLIIVADPGTTICEGDPTLLTVYNAGAATGPGTLYTQGTAAVNGSPSQVFEPANAAFDSQAADDFTVPASTNWSITNITTAGINSAGGVPTSVNVFFYANTGNLPGAAIASYTNVLTFVRTGANYNVTLPTPLNLGAGGIL